MYLLLYAIPLLGAILELCLVWRLLFRGLWRVYPFFFLYAVYIFVGTACLFGTVRLFPDRYPGVYWVIESVSIALRFLLIWEVSRHTFTQTSALYRVVSKGFGVIVFSVVVFSVASFWSYGKYPQLYSVHAAIDRSLGFAQAALVLGMLLAAQYYGIQLGRNVWGMAVALGAYASILTANNAVIELAHSFLPYWRILDPLSFVAMLGVWIWAVWVEAPNPLIVSEESATVEPEFVRWAEDWNRTVASVRKAMNP